MVSHRVTAWNRLETPLAMRIPPANHHQLRRRLSTMIICHDCLKRMLQCRLLMLKKTTHQVMKEVWSSHQQYFVKPFSIGREISTDRNKISTFRCGLAIHQSVVRFSSLVKFKTGF
uniref:Uncharacterized protein n=1 Tax=Cacopsylla melanoneura TaxID=428564 RepID=A0A8D9ECM6_9HEMI